MAGLTPFVIFGASFLFGIFMWILPEVGNCYSKISTAVFPLQDEGQFEDDHDLQADVMDDHEQNEEDDEENREKEDEENGREETRGARETLGDYETEAPAPPRMSAVMLLLHSYINSVLGLDKGVFSGHSFVYRLWYEWSLHNAYFAPLRTEMNGPYGFLVESREEFVMPSAPSSSLPQQQTYVSQHAKIVLSSGAWNRGVRAIRLVTNLNVAFTVMGLLYYNQYPDTSGDVALKCMSHGTKAQCLTDSISFLEKVPYCAFSESSGKCAANADPPLSLQFLVLCTLLAALIMTPLQWPLDSFFSFLLVFPKIETPAFSSFSAAPASPSPREEDEDPATADESHLRQLGPDVFQDQDDDIHTACPSVDNARRHYRLQNHFDSLDSQRRHTALLSSLESGEPLSPLGHLATQADRDVVAELYASFPVSRLHRLEDRNMRRLVELLALLEGLKAYRSSMGAGVERLAFERQWGVVAAPDSLDDFYLIGKSMLVRDDQTTLYDLVCMHLFHAADNYVDVTEVEIRMAEAKKNGLEACRALRVAALRQSPQQSECLAAFELVRHFGADFLGGSQSLAGRLFMAKSATCLPFCLGASGTSNRWRWAVVFTVNVVAIAIIMGIFTKVSTAWELGWFAACCMHVVLDALAYQTCAAVLTAFVLPDQVRRTVRHSLQLVAPTFEYVWASTEDPECAAPLGISAEDVKQSLLCAPRFLYSSRKLAESLPHKFEVDLVRRFNTAWLMPALRPVPGHAHAATAVSAHAARMQMGSSFPRASSTVQPFPMSTPHTLPVARERPSSEQENEGALGDPESEHDGADALMEEGFGESESFLRALLLRMTDLPMGLQRTLVNVGQIFPALVLGYAAFITNPSAPAANALATYVLLYIPWALLCVMPYLPLPSCRSIRRALPAALGARKAVVAPVEDVHEGAVLEGLMLKALERASRLLDEDEYVLRERAGPTGRGNNMQPSSSAASVALTDDSRTDESDNHSVRLGSRQEEREKGDKVEPVPSKTLFSSPSSKSVTRVAPEPLPAPLKNEEVEELEVDWSEMNEPNTVAAPPAPAVPVAPVSSKASAPAPAPSPAPTKTPPSKKAAPAKPRSDASLMHNQDDGDEDPDVGDQSDVSAAFRARMEAKARLQSEARSAGALAEEGAALGALGARGAALGGADEGEVLGGKRRGAGGLEGRDASERMRLDDIYDDYFDEGGDGQPSDLSFSRRAAAGMPKLSGLGKAHDSLKKTGGHGQGQAGPALAPFQEHGEYDAADESAKLHNTRKEHLQNTIDELERHRLENGEMELLVQQNRLQKQESRLSEKRRLSEEEAAEEERILAEFERDEAEKLAAARRQALIAQDAERAKRAEEQRAEEQRAREQKAEEQRAREQKAEEQRAEEQRAEEQRAREQRAREQRAREQRAIEERAEEQRAREQRAIEQRAEDARRAETAALAELEAKALASKQETASTQPLEQEADPSMRAVRPSAIGELHDANLGSDLDQGADWVPPSQRSGPASASQEADAEASAKWVSPAERARKAAEEKETTALQAEKADADWVPPSARARVAEEQAKPVEKAEGEAEEGEEGEEGKEGEEGSGEENGEGSDREEGSSDGSSDGPDEEEDGEDDGVQLRGKKAKKVHKRDAKKNWKLGARLSVLKQKTKGATMAEQMVIAGKMHDVRSDLDFGYTERPEGAEKKKKKEKTQIEKLIDAARAGANAGPEASSSDKIKAMKEALEDDKDASP